LEIAGRTLRDPQFAVIESIASSRARTGLDVRLPIPF
jgi:hypothetical protein